MKRNLSLTLLTLGGLLTARLGIPTANPAVSSLWQPEPGDSFQIQFTGALDATVDTTVYDVDLFDTPQSFIDTLHEAGRKVVCYYSAGIYEPRRPDSDKFHHRLFGNEVEGYPGEYWLDIRQGKDFKRLEWIMQERLDLAVSKHCDGVQPDNVDAFTYDTGFPLTYQDQLAYNRWTAEQSHMRGLAVGLTNDHLQIGDLVDLYDFAINEQCFTFNECNLLAPFIWAGKPVFQINYGYTETEFLETICPQAAALGFHAILKNRSLDAYRVACP